MAVRRHQLGAVRSHLSGAVVDLVASRRHYYDHLAAVWRALPPGMRGTAWLDRDLVALDPRARPLQARPRGDNRWTLCASFADLRLAGGTQTILMEHGAGQSYGGSRETAHLGGYAGGTGRHAALFLHPNEYAADRDRAVYPDTRVEVVGSPRLAGLQSVPLLPPGVRPTVAFTFHWHSPACPETGSGFGYWWRAVLDLHRAGEVEVLGHAHPRLLPDVARIYGRAGIEVVPSFEQLLSRSDCLVVDNSSVLWEFAAVRGPVVVLDNPGYRHDVDHGLRFWDAADVGPRVNDPADLAGAIGEALTVTPWPGAEAILGRVFPAVEDPATTAAQAIRSVVG